MKLTDPSNNNQTAPDELPAQIEAWSATGDYEMILADLPKLTTTAQTYLATLALSRAYIKRGKYAEAEACLRQVSERGRDDALWQYHLAEAQLLQGNTETALKHALVAREKDPQNPWSYFLLGKLFYFNGNKTAAKEYVQTGRTLAHQANCDDRDFVLLLQKIENNSDPKELLKHSANPYLT